MKRDVCLRPNWQILCTIWLGENDPRTPVIKSVISPKYDGEANIYRLRILTLSAAVFVLTMPLQVLAAEEGHGGQKELPYHRHHIGLLLGNTHEEHEDTFTVGLDYEYRFCQYLGIGVLGEYLGEDFREGVFLVPLFIHPYKGLRFIAAPGIKPKKEDDKFLWRLGVGYRFPIGNWTIAPEFNVDFSEGEKGYVYGISVGYGF